MALLVLSFSFFLDFSSSDSLFSGFILIELKAKAVDYKII